MKINRRYWILPADLKAVDILCNSVKTWFNKLNLEREIFAVTMLLRESLNNAIIHGCKLDNSLRVYCDIKIENFEVKITVKDEGSGFDWKREINKCVDPTATSGRGICIYKIYSNTVTFNHKGNRVSFTRKLST